MKQRTVAKEVKVRGVGIHTGKEVRAVIKPLPPNSGVVFKCMETGRLIPASLSMVSSTDRATTLGGIRTTEHVLSALYGLGIDNALVEVYGPELPVMDGSALPLANAILDAGIEEQEEEKRAFYVRESFSFERNGKRFTISPSDKLVISYHISYPPPIGEDSFTFVFSFKNYYYKIAPSRTFGFIEDYWKLKRCGLAKGSSLGNTVVVSRKGTLNQLRFPNEFVRHKILDLIGDLALLGVFLVGRIEVFMGGHGLHCAALKKFLEDSMLYAYPLNGCVDPRYPSSLIRFFC